MLAAGELDLTAFIGRKDRILPDQRNGNLGKRSKKVNEARRNQAYNEGGLEIRSHNSAVYVPLLKAEFDCWHVILIELFLDPGSNMTSEPLKARVAEQASDIALYIRMSIRVTTNRGQEITSASFICKKDPSASSPGVHNASSCV